MPRPRDKKPFFIVNPDNGCWEWNKSLLPSGYGQISVKNRFNLAHRVFYVQYKGEIPKGCVIDHLCRNPKCVNPNHLEAVTQKENTLRGLSTKLTMTLIEFIRAIIKNGGVSQARVAKYFGISQSHVSLITNGKRRVA